MTELEKRSVTFEFPDESTLREFLGYMSDGGGEYNFLVYSEDLSFDYKECFPTWGWNGETQRKVVCKK